MSNEQTMELRLRCAELAVRLAGQLMPETPKDVVACAEALWGFVGGGTPERNADANAGIAEKAIELARDVLTGINGSESAHFFALDLADQGLVFPLRQDVGD